MERNAGPVCISSLFSCAFLLGTWVHRCYDILRNKDCCFLLFLMLCLYLCGYLILGLLRENYFLTFSRVYFSSLWWHFLYVILLIESLAGYSSLGWHLCSHRVCMTPAQDLPAFIVSGEKSGIILIGLPLYVTLPFNILSLVHFVFWLLVDRRNFLSSTIYLVFCRLVCLWAFLSLG